MHAEDVSRDIQVGLVDWGGRARVKKMMVMMMMMTMMTTEGLASRFTLRPALCHRWVLIENVRLLTAEVQLLQLPLLPLLPSALLDLDSPFDFCSSVSRSRVLLYTGNTVDDSLA